MKSLVSVLVLLFVAVAQALSSTGNRVLAIFEDVSEKATYSKFLGDLTGIPPA